MMLDCDRVSLGWQVWLTPRQTKIIYDALRMSKPMGGPHDDAAWNKLKEWFGAEVQAKAQVRGTTDGRKGAMMTTIPEKSKGDLSL